MKTLFLTVISVLLCSLLLAETSITIFNENFATVRTKLQLDLKKGVNEYRFTDIPTYIKPTSVKLNPIKKTDKIIIYSQNYEYDLANTNKVLDKYLDKNIELIVKKGDVFSGILKAFDSNSVMIQKSGSDEIFIINKEEMQNINLAKMPENFYTKPTLRWLLYSDKSGKREVELNYITDNIKWDAQYVAQLNKDDNAIDLSSWISLDNRSGKRYEDVKLKLMAGAPHLVREKPVYARDIMPLSAKGMPEEFGVTEKEFYEYYLYTVKQTVSINNNQQKQISLFDPTNVIVEKVFTYNCNPKGDINTSIKFVNSEKNGLGIPLPKGLVRIFKRDAEDDVEFIGEDEITHSPKDEEIELKVGVAFDVKGEFTVLHTERISKRARKEEYQVELRNHKDKDITIEVTKRLGRDWEITNASDDYEKKDAFTAKFIVKVKANQNKVINFTVRFNY
ncbi:MAG: hypothetical protein DRH57_04880 [Candidatus Cloacimonadota bacterium]|nr:MAG: hypothetical protein DRH57_04880 [Candidatus Cloacimonadota bacterium]